MIFEPDTQRQRYARGCSGRLPSREYATWAIALLTRISDCIDDAAFAARKAVIIFTGEGTTWSGGLSS